jgi:magnesium-transporting ATPase (P-type)
MKITKNEVTYNVDDKEVQAIVAFSVKMDELLNGNRSYGREDIIEIVKNSVAHKLVEKVIAENEAEILKQIDFDSIVRRIQLRVIDNFSPNRER